MLVRKLMLTTLTCLTSSLTPPDFCVDSRVCSHLVKCIMAHSIDLNIQFRSQFLHFLRSSVTQLLDFASTVRPGMIVRTWGCKRFRKSTLYNGLGVIDGDI